MGDILVRLIEQENKIKVIKNVNIEKVKLSVFTMTWDYRENPWEYPQSIKLKSKFNEITRPIYKIIFISMHQQ